MDQFDHNSPKPSTLSEISPKVPMESNQPYLVPVFSNNNSLLAHCIDRPNMLSFQKKPSTDTSYTHSDTPRNASMSTKAGECECPQVLIADDDPFQGFYYQTLFQGPTLYSENEFENKKNIRFKISQSGEELLDKYKKIKQCGCGSPTLVITDYFMGDKKMNGVQTALALRKAGYTGTIVLRTSERTEDLKKTHKNFNELIEGKTIEYHLDKASHAKTKETIRNLLFGGL